MLNHGTAEVLPKEHCPSQRQSKPPPNHQLANHNDGAKSMTNLGRDSILKYRTGLVCGSCTDRNIKHTIGYPHTRQRSVCTRMYPC